MNEKIRASIENARVLMFRILILLSLTVSLSGCSTFGFLFERLPWLSSWQLSSMFDLSNAQEEQVEEVAEHMKTWLETEGFPVLLADLEKSKAKWQSEPSASVINDVFQQLENSSDRFLRVLAPKFGPIAIDLDENNLAQFQDYIDEGMKDWFEHLSSELDKEDKRIEKLEDWFGDLSDDQVMLVRDQIELLPDELAVRQENTRHWVAFFNNAVRAKDSAAIEQWLRQPSIWWTQGYAQSRELNRAQIIAAINAIFPSLTDRQKSHAISEFDDWIENLHDVIE